MKCTRSRYEGDFFPLFVLICGEIGTQSRMKGKQHGNFSQQNSTPHGIAQGTGGLGNLARRDWGSSYDAARGRRWLVDQGYRGSLNGLAPPVGSALPGASESCTRFFTAVAARTAGRR